MRNDDKTYAKRKQLAERRARSYRNYGRREPVTMWQHLWALAKNILMID